MTTDRASSQKRLVWTLGVLFFSMVACSTPPAESPRDETRRQLSECTRQYGYDPQRTEVAENQLAPGERPWRSCAYAAIEQLVIPRSLVSPSYRGLIAEDRQMTDAIEHGSMTRSQRRARLEAALNRIEAAEQDLSHRQLEATRRTAQQQAQQTEMIWQMQQQAIMASQLSAIRAGLR